MDFGHDSTRSRTAANTNQWSRWTRTQMQLSTTSATYPQTVALLLARILRRARWGYINQNGYSLQHSLVLILSIQARLIIKLNGIEFQRIDRDICDGVLKSNVPQLKNIIQLFGLPDSCPIKAGTVCATEDQKISLNRYKDFLALAAGKVEILIKVLHGSVGKSCIRVDFEIFR